MATKSTWGYSTNIMGPYGLWWYEENYIPFEMITINNKFTNFKDERRKKYLETYFGGRIDTYCDNEDDPDCEHYMPELNLPIMISSEFAKFDEFVENVKTDRLVTFEELRELYEKEHGKLVLFGED